jgi:hypothetical protein
VRQPEDPRQRGEAVQLAPALLADARASVEREAEDDHHPAADDPHRHPDRLVGADERDCDVGEAGMQEAVAQERDRVHHERDDGRHRQRLVSGPQIGPAALDQLAAHAHADAHGDAREEQRQRARRAARDPEQMVVDGGGEHGAGA